jgi:hypothetical protein
MGRVLGLYDHPPADGRVICADEFGPLNLQPRPGRSWQPNGHPARLRATYHRDNGVRHMLAALDLATGKMIYRIRERKGWREFLSFLKALRQHRPTQKLYVIADNFSPHKAPERASLGGRQRHRNRLLTDLYVLAQLDRIRVRRPALLRAQRHRPPQPRRASRRDRGLHALAQRPSPTQTRLRPRPRLSRSRSR